MVATSRKKTAAILSLSAIMYTAYVGPGFASGTQTVSYFNNKGWIGIFLGPALAGLLCFVFSILLFEVNRIYQPVSYRDAYNTIYRPKRLQLFFGTFKEIQVISVVLIALSAQISTTAILLNQIFGVPRIIGTIGFCILVLLFALLGAGVLRKMGAIFGIAVLLVCAGVAIICLKNAIPLANNYLEEHISYTSYGFSASQAWFSMLTIVVFFMNGYDACVPASRGVLKTRKDIILQSTVTAVLCAGSTMIFTYIFSAGMPDIMKEDIPTLWAIDTLSNSGNFSKILYAIFAIGAMVSSSVAFIFTVCNRFEPLLAKKWKNSSISVRKFLIAIIFVLICTFGSSLGLINIIKYGYGGFTMIVGPVMLIPLIVSVPYRLWKDKKDGILDENYTLITKTSER